MQDVRDVRQVVRAGGRDGAAAPPGLHQHPEGNPRMHI